MLVVHENETSKHQAWSGGKGGKALLFSPLKQETQEIAKTKAIILKRLHF